MDGFVCTRVCMCVHTLVSWFVYFSSFYLSLFFSSLFRYVVHLCAHVCMFVCCLLQRKFRILCNNMLFARCATSNAIILYIICNKVNRTPFSTIFTTEFRLCVFLFLFFLHHHSLLLLRVAEKHRNPRRQWFSMCVWVCVYFSVNVV